MSSTPVSPYVLVVGSANVDVSVRTATLPRPGETVIGRESLLCLGGKGANQAVAAVAGGAATHFVGRVGDDAFGRLVREGLHARNVNIEQLGTVPGTATGIATISVEDSSKNSIIVVPGANARLLPFDMEALAGLVRGAAAVILQCEIPMDTVYRTVELAAACATQVILNPAPFRGLDLARIAGRVACLVPNETEAAQLYGHPVDSIEEAKHCGAWLRSQGMPCAIITLGAQGCVVVDEFAARHYAGHVVSAIDTTGAGDAFVGCLAASLAAGKSRDESVSRALLFAALSTTRRGAQDSYPTREEFERAVEAAAPPA